MISTALDYAIFCQMLLNGGTYGHRRILSAKMVRQATQPQTHRIAASQHYGLGWFVSPETGIFSHAGSDGTWAWVDRRHQLIGLVFTQTQRESTHRERFRDLIIEACAPASGR